MKQEEKNVLMDHDYDGIQEFDYSLPNWWLATFWGGIVFAVFYIVYFIFMNGPSLKHEYFAEAKKINTIRTKYMSELKKFDEVKFNSFRSDNNMVLFGQSVFENNCLACHNQNAAGDIGPNLTDNYWMFVEGKNKEIFQFIITGNPPGGMPAWGKVLSKDELYGVTAYISSMRGFKHTDPLGKEPEGEEYPVE